MKTFKLSKLFLIFFALVFFGVTIVKHYSKPSQVESYKIDDVVSLIEAKRDSCKNLEQHQGCLNKIAIEMLSKFSFADILQAYRITQAKDSRYSCHDIMHHIASNEYKNKKNLAGIFDQCNSACFNGCYHGAAVGYLTDSSLGGTDTKHMAESLLHACDSVTIQKGNCAHGLGHALMLITENELPQALSLCDLLESKGFSVACYEGVFMENFPNSSTSDHPIKYIKKDDPLYPCNILDKKYLKKCFTYLTDYFSFINNHDMSKVAKMCALIPKPYERECYRTIGSGALGKVKAITDLADFCDIVPQEDPRKDCIKGIVLSFSTKFGGDKEKMLPMFEFCKSVEKQYKDVCYNGIGINLYNKRFSQDEKENLCSAVEDKDNRHICLNPNVKDEDS